QLPLRNPESLETHLNVSLDTFDSARCVQRPMKKKIRDMSKMIVLSVCGRIKNVPQDLQEETECPSSLSVIKERTAGETLEDDFSPPEDLSSDEEYYIEENKATQFRKSGRRRIDDIKKAFSRENIQKTRQNFGKKVKRLRTRIVTPERRERIRQSGERLKQSGIRIKKTISQAAPTKETFKIHKKNKERTGAEGQEGIQEASVHITSELAAAEPFTEEISYSEVITKVKKDKNGATKGASQSIEKGVTIPELVLKQEVKEGGEGSDDVPLLDLKPSALRIN
ncbi:PREDICTED: muscle-related coiled-coil protein-like, partial [Buceros rhinoceros silvestris]